MDYLNIILSTAKAFKISSTLLLAVCTHESGLKNTHTMNDAGSPSYGLCQIKMATARMMGYKGNEKTLMEAKTNVYWSAKYLKYQLNRYDWNFCKATAAYNSGTYFESKRNPDRPTNMVYVQHVREKLPDEAKRMLNCDPNAIETRIK